MKARAHLSEIKDRSCRCSDLSCRKSVTFFKHAPSAFPLCGYFTKDALPSSVKADAAAQTAELQLLSAAPRAFTKNKQREVMLLMVSEEWMGIHLSGCLSTSFHRGSPFRHARRRCLQDYRKLGFRGSVCLLKPGIFSYMFFNLNGFFYLAGTRC